MSLLHISNPQIAWNDQYYRVTPPSAWWIGLLFQDYKKRSRDNQMMGILDLPLRLNYKMVDTWCPGGRRLSFWLSLTGDPEAAVAARHSLWGMKCISDTSESEPANEGKALISCQPWQKGVKVGGDLVPLTQTWSNVFEKKEVPLQCLRFARINTLHLVFATKYGQSLTFHWD